MKAKKRSKEQLIENLDKFIAEYTAKYGNDTDELYEMIALERTNTEKGDER